MKLRYFVLAVLFVYSIPFIGSAIDKILIQNSTSYRVKSILETGIQLKNAQNAWTQEEKESVTEILVFAYTKWKVDPRIVIAHWQHESEMKWWAKGQNSSSIDTGIAQINSKTFPGLRQEAIGYYPKDKWKKILIRRNPYDPECAALLSAYYIKRSMSTYGKYYVTSYCAGYPAELYNRCIAYKKAVTKNYRVLVAMYQ